jgi:hypothetical protein
MPWLTKKQAADYLNVCESTIDNMESAGLLEGHRVYLSRNRKKPIVRYHQEDLDALFLKRSKGRPRQENEAVLRYVRGKSETVESQAVEQQ